MKVFTIISAIILMSSNSCGEPEPFDAANGQRSFVSGRLLNEQGDGIDDYDIEILSDFDRIGIATTDSSGYYETTIIESIYGLSNIKVQPLTLDTELTSFNLRYRYDEPQSSRSFAFDDITLKKKAEVSFEINNSSGSPFSARVAHAYAWCNYEYQEDILSSTNCFMRDSRFVNGINDGPIYVPLGTVFTIQITRNAVTTDYDYIIDQENYEILLDI